MTVRIESIVGPEITVASAGGLSSDLQVLVDNRPVISIHYVYPWIDNAGQWALAEKIAKQLKGEE